MAPQQKIRHRVVAPRGFTLLELVVVMVIIMILASVLLALFNRAHRAGQRTACSYNLHTLGLVLAAYANDKQAYPYKQPLVAGLVEDGYLTSNAASELVCPLDTSDAKDTYSVGYLSGFPTSISVNDPLIVCGWHRDLGVLAVFPDQRVDLVRAVQAADVTNTTAATSSDTSASSGGSTSTSAPTLVPVTFAYNGRTQTVEPGFVLPSNGLVVNSADGHQAVLYGSGHDDTYLISAAYDPTANGGQGMFSVSLGYNASSHRDESQVQTRSASQTPVEVVMRLGFMAIQMVSDPTQNSSKLEFKDTTNNALAVEQLKLIHFGQFKVVHIVTGQVQAGTSATNPTQIQIDATNATLSIPH